MAALRAILFAVGVVLFGFTAQAQLGAEDYYAQCQRLYQQTALDAAQSTCLLAIAADKTHLPSLKLLARIGLERKQAIDADVYIQQALALNTSDPELLYLQARSSYLQNKPADALVELPNSTDTEVVLLRGQALEALGRYEEAQSDYRRISGSVEGRLGFARIAERLGHPEEALGVLGSSPRERLAAARLMWIAGKTQESAQALEDVLPRLPPEDDYTKTLGLLANVYYGLGEFDKGSLVLRQLSARTSLPSNLLAKIWPWLMLLLVYLGILLYGESRIEPMRTVEMTSERKYGPGSLHIWILISLLIAGLAAVVVGQALYQNLLAGFTPLQGDLVRPVFYIVMGASLFLIAMQTFGREGITKVVGPRQTWLDGIWAGVVLLVLLGIYSVISRSLSLGGLHLIYPMFFGLALLEIIIRGAGQQILHDRYRELTNYMVPMLFALVIPGPTFYFLVCSVFLGWLAQRTKGVGAGALAWVAMAILLALVGNLPAVRTLLS